MDGLYSPPAWNQVRFNFTPTHSSSGKDFSLPFNFNFAAVPTNFAGPQADQKPELRAVHHQPDEQFGLNQKYKWAELQLGTQYLKYSDLSTGDIGIFQGRCGSSSQNLAPNSSPVFRREGVNYFAGPPTVTSAYKRKNWMVQVGNEGRKIFVCGESCQGKDVPASSAPPQPPSNHRRVVISDAGNVYVDKIYFKGEAASTFTKDVTTPTTTLLRELKPFIEPHTSSLTDFLPRQLSVGRKSTN